MSTASPVTCSGAMYRGVPITIPVRVSPVSGLERSVQLRPREAEVEQLHAVGGQEDVGRFQVAMDDPARVQRGERGQHAQTDRHRLRRAQRPLSQPLGQRFAFEQLHRDEQPAAVLADFVDLADVRMVDARRRPGLAPQALPRRLVVGERRQRLHGDGALETIVARRVDDAHAAFPQLAFDRIAADASRQDLSRGSARGVRRGSCGDVAPVSHS